MKKGKPNVTQWKRILRATLCFALILTLALGNIVPLEVAKAEGESSGDGTTDTTQTTTDLLNLDFDGEWSEFGTKLLGNSNALLGETAPDTVNSTTPVAQITYPVNSDNKCLRLYSPGSSRTNLTYSIGDITGEQVVYEYKLSAVDGETKHCKTKLFLDSEGGALYYLRSGGKIKTNNESGDGYGTVSSEEWTKVSLVADCTGSSITYKLYVNDVYQDSGTLKEGRALSSLRIRLDKDDSNPTAIAGHILLDDMQIYYGSVPRVLINATETTTSYEQGSNRVVKVQTTGNPVALSETSPVMVDDVVVEATNNYTLTSTTKGETVVTFTSDYLETLSVGTHKVTLNYTEDRSVDSQLTINPRPVNIIPDGTTTSYQKQSESVVTINCDGPTDELQSVKNGETTLTENTHYTVSGEDTTIVTLANAYLDTFVAGIHTVTLGYTEGRTASADLLIKQPVATQKDIVNMDFEGEWAEFATTIGVSLPSANVMQIADPKNPINKCLKLVRDGKDVSVVDVNAEGNIAGEKVVYEYKLSVIEGESISYEAKLFTDWPNVTRYLTIDSNGGIKITKDDTNAVKTVVPGEWVTIAMAVDYSQTDDGEGNGLTGTYKLYVDGICVKDDGKMDLGGNGNGRSLMRIRLTKNGHILMDDLRMYYGSEPLTDYIPTSGGAVTLNTSATTTSYEKSTDAFVTVKTDGLTSELQSVKIKSNTLGETVLTKDTDYTLSDTVTTTVTLKNDYLNKLAAGEYTVILVYSGDRSVGTKLTVKPASISIVEEGTVTSYEKGSESAVTINCDGPATELESVEIGDTALEAGNYTVSGEDATTVTLNNDYLYTLEPGNYEVTLVYSEGRSVTSSLAITVAAVGIAQGTTTSYQQASAGEVKILADAPATELVKVIVGTTELKDTDYTVSGTDSTEITIASTFLKTLLAGDCTITLNYTDNRSATTTLTVTPAEIAVVTDGTITAYLQRNGETVTVKTDGFAAELLSVQIGTTTLVKDTDYTVSGTVTTTITLANNCLDALKAGSHTITLNYNNDRSVTSDLTVTEKTAAQADIVNLDFEAEWAEFATEIGVDASTARVMQIIDPANPANKCLKLVHLGDDTKVTIGYVGAEGDVTGKQIVYEYKISAVPGEKISNRPNFFTNHPIVTTHLTSVTNDDLGEIRFSKDGETLATFGAGDWTKIAMVINYADATETTTGTYKIYVNGVCVKNDGVISNIDSTGADKGTQSYVRVRLSNAGHILIDDWRIYEGSEPLAEYAAAPVTNVELDVDGTTTSYQKETDDFVTVRSTGAKADFVGVRVNGTELAADNYVVSDVTDSTVVTLDNAYLDTLASGDYTVTLLFDGDRSVETALEVTPASVEIIADGTTTSFEKGKDTVVTIKAARTYEDLKSVMVNGRERVKDRDYTVTGDADTTTITFTEEYLNDIDAGVYTITLGYSEERTAVSRLEVTLDPANSELFVPDYLYLDFNGEWSEFGSYINKASGPSATVLQVDAPTADDADNKALKIVRNGSNVNIQFPVGDGFDFTGKQIVYEYKLSALEGEAITTNAKIFASKSDTRYLSVRSNGYIRFNTESNVDPLGIVTPGEWIDLAMVVDYVSNTYKIYVDGVCVKDDGTFSGKTFMRITVAADGHILIDDLRVYAGTEPHVPGTAAPVGTEVYVNRTFDEIYKYDFEEIEVTKDSGSVAVTGTDNQYLELAGTASSPANVTYVTDAESNFIVAQAQLSVESATGNAGSIFNGVDSDGKTLSFLDLKDGSVQLPDGMVVATITPGSWTDIAVAVNVDEKTYTVYLDGEKVPEATNVAITEIANLASIETTVIAGSLLVDDLRVYDAKKPQEVWNVNDTPDTIYVSDSEVQELLGDARAIQLNANTLYADGVKSVATKAFERSEDGKVYLALADIKTLFGENAVLTGVSEKNGCYDVIASAEANGYPYVTELEDRLFVFSASEVSLTETNVKEINKYLLYERPSVEKIKELYNRFLAANNGDAHPSVLVTQSDVDRIKRLYDNGETYIKLWGDNAIAAAEEALTTEDFDYHLTGSSMTHVDQALPMIINLGMAYFLADDAKAKDAYVEKAKSMAMIICNLDNWNPASYLDVGELSFILGIAYDWFYDEFTGDERAFIEKNLMEKGVGIQNKIYYGQVDSSEVYWTWWDNTNNWNAVCNGGAMLGAVALFDAYPDICAQVISNSLHGLEFMMESYYPEGVWHEGGGYWRYSLNYMAYTMTTFDNVFGDDFNFLSSPGLDQTGWYGLKLSGSTGINNFGDAGTAFINNPSVIWCATTFQDAELLAARLQEMELQGYTGAGRDIIWYDETLLGDTTAELPLDTVLDSMSVVSLREKWYDIGATYLGFSGTKTKSGHAHMDIGAFVVDMLGERVIGDIGAEDYNSDGYFSTSRYYYYRARPEGHNVYIINPTEDRDDYGGFTPWVETTNTPIVAKDRGAFSTLDLSNVYAEDTNSAVRGYMLTDDRRSALVRDEIDLKHASEIYSYMHTKAAIEFDEEDPNVAILTLNGTKFKVIIDVQGDAIESYTFKAVAAESRADYNVTDSSNSAWQKLEIYVKTNAPGMVNITMKIVGFDDPAADVELITTPIAQWSAEMIPDGEAREIPVVDMIYLNGEPVKNFEPKVTGYTGRLSSTALLPVVTATSETYDRIEITQASDFGEDYIVKVYDNEDENLYRVYRLNYTRLPALEPVDGRIRYAVANATASASPEEETYGYVPEGVIDNDFVEMRWTSQCENEGESHWIMLELDEASMVHKIGIAFARGHKRQTIFKIEASVDGENWTEVFDGMSSGTTEGLEYFYESETGIEAKYVRYTGWGNTLNGWNNLLEFVVLGPKDSAEESYELDSNDAVEILHNGTAANLESVKLDGVVVDPANYTAADGNIDTVTLKTEYLNTLTVGDHELTLNYEDGSSAAWTLTVEAAGSSTVAIIPEGKVGSYELGSGDTVSIHATGAKADLIGVEVDDELIDHDNYEVSEGSTIVTFTKAYLESLSVGTHKVTLLYTGGRSTETKLVIKAAPQTTEESSEESTEETTGGSAEESTEESTGENTEGSGEESTEGSTQENAAESTEASAEGSTDNNTDETAGGETDEDPNTGDISGAGIWLWLMLIAMVAMTGYMAMAGFDRKKQK